ncbi:MAG TPA: hypothetical protein VEH04_05125 [Verrucomicrobiae bacterium]|nr:hypothetical protein [Verrucomicrobiae bacterium]
MISVNVPLKVQNFDIGAIPEGVKLMCSPAVQSLEFGPLFAQVPDSDFLKFPLYETVREKELRIWHSQHSVRVQPPRRTIKGVETKMQDPIGPSNSQNLVEGLRWIWKMFKRVVAKREIETCILEWQALAAIRLHEVERFCCVRSPVFQIGQHHSMTESLKESRKHSIPSSQIESF